MILKEKEFTNPSDARLRAGEEAEKQMAYYLQREFRKRDDCFVINDLRVIHDGDIAQIDHLIVSIFGLIVVESKSAHVIGIDQHGGWQRTYNDQVTGMPSPVLQAQAQGKILKELLISHKEKLLGKIFFGKMQKGFSHCPVEAYIAISDNGIIQRGMDIPELFKADAVTGAITEKLAQLKSKLNLLAPKNFFSTDVVWDMSKQEAQAVAEFLVSVHTPSVLPRKIEPVIAKAYSKLVTSSSIQQFEKAFVPKAGALCPECGNQKLIRKSIKRSDGTETDFLACQDYPSICKALFPLVAVVRQVIPNYETSETPVIKPTDDARACPTCGAGKLVRHNGRNGKPDFFGCSNYRKTKCGFQKPII